MLAEAESQAQNSAHTQANKQGSSILSTASCDSELSQLPDAASQLVSREETQQKDQSLLRRSWDLPSLLIRKLLLASNCQGITELSSPPREHSCLNDALFYVLTHPTLYSGRPRLPNLSSNHREGKDVRMNVRCEVWQPLFIDEELLVHSRNVMAFVHAGR